MTVVRAEMLEANQNQRKIQLEDVERIFECVYIREREREGGEKEREWKRESYEMITVVVEGTRFCLWRRNTSFARLCPL